jgi:hypothetical protein
MLDSENWKILRPEGSVRLWDQIFRVGTRWGDIRLWFRLRIYQVGFYSENIKEKNPLRGNN